MENETHTQETEVKQVSVVSEAIKAAERLELANKQMQENIKKLEELRAFEMLGGTTDGKAPEEKPVEISPKDYVKSIMNGGN